MAVDYERETGKPIPTLPNLTYKVFQGDSIIDKLFNYHFDYLENLRSGNILSDAALRKELEDLKTLKEEYFIKSNEEEKKNLKGKIEKKKLEIAIKILEAESREKDKTQGTLLPQYSAPKQTRLLLEQEMKKDRKELINTLKILLKNKKYTEANKGDKLNFVWKIDLVEFFADHDQGGFDIVLGNPPYGVKNEAMEKGKERYGLGSKDSYGVFMAMAFQDLLKTGGMLSFITSDTWQTIKTHKPLRRFILDNAKVFNLIMMPPWLFGATVNTSILIAEKSERGRAVGKAAERVIFENAKEREVNTLIACDFTRAEKNTGELDECLYSLDEPEEVSTPKKAIYRYKQGLIETNSNIPFFVGSPKLFAFMNDSTAKIVEKKIGEKEKLKVKVRQIELNEKNVELVRFGDIADVKVGLQTGDNQAYLFQNPEARGNYRSINDYLEFLLTEEDLKKISSNKILRIKAINKGIHKSETEKSFDSELWFGGRYIAPYDKGGESDTESGWLPNYYVPTEYYINWSCEVVNELQSNPRARFQNSQFYFREGLTLSYTGQYAPNLRINSRGAFDVGGSSIFPIINDRQLLGNFVCKITKYIAKTWIDHTVNFQVDENKELPILISDIKKLQDLVEKIIENQKQNPRYDYMSNEQKEIDKLVYEMYGLNEDDIREVETWYARRYPKLARFCDVS